MKPAMQTASRSDDCCSHMAIVTKALQRPCACKLQKQKQPQHMIIHKQGGRVKIQLQKCRWQNMVFHKLAYFLVFLWTQIKRALMAFRWSFTVIDMFLSTLGVLGWDVSDSGPLGPEDRLEEEEFLLRLPVSSLICNKRWSTQCSV